MGFERLVKSAGGGIKSIQNGNFYGGLTTVASGSFQDYTDITISSVDMSKCLIIITGVANTDYGYHGAIYGNSTSYSVALLGILQSATVLRVGSYASNRTFKYAAFTWQVVEYV